MPLSRDLGHTSEENKEVHRVTEDSLCGPAERAGVRVPGGVLWQEVGLSEKQTGDFHAGRRGGQMWLKTTGL